MALLLYCVGGVVHATHDDAQNIPASAYGPDCFIVPYDASMGGIKVGQPQPAETPAILKLYASQVRFNTVNAGFTFTAASGVVPVATDGESYMLVTGGANYAQTLGSSAPIDFTQGGNHYLLTAREMTQLFNQFSALIQQCRTIEANCIADLNSATPTILTYADVDAKFAGVETLKAH